MRKKRANSTPQVDPNLPKPAFSLGAGKSGGKRIPKDSIGYEKGAQRSVSARKNANIGKVC